MTLTRKNKKLKTLKNNYSTKFINQNLTLKNIKQKSKKNDKQNKDLFKLNLFNKKIDENKQKILSKKNTKEISIFFDKNPNMKNNTYNIHKTHKKKISSMTPLNRRKILSELGVMKKNSKAPDRVVQIILNNLK